MKKAFITLEDTLVDTSNYEPRPGSNELIYTLRDCGYQVFIMSERGSEFAKRWHEMMHLPAVAGFQQKADIRRDDPDLVIDSVPAFMTKFVGYCVRPWNVNMLNDIELSNISSKIRKEGEYPAG